MIVDSHLHLFRHGYGRFAPGRIPLGDRTDLEAYEELRAIHDIEAGLVVCYEDDGIDPSNNAYVRDLAASRPWINSVSYLRPAPMPDRRGIEDMLRSGHCGIALYLPDAASAKTLSDWPADCWTRLSEARAIVSLNARPEATLHLRPLIERTAGCSFVFSHLGLPGPYPVAPDASRAAERLAPLLSLAALPNVAVKLSGLYAIDPHPPHRAAQPFVDLLLQRFGPENLHWGSDFSPVLEFEPFRRAFDLDCLSALTPWERRLIMGEGLSARLKAVQTGRG